MPEQAAVDFEAAIKRGWEAFTRKPVELILGMLLAQLSMVLVVTAGAAMLGMAMMALAVVRGQEVSVTTALDGFKYFLSSFVLILLLAVAIGVGFALCLVPGLVLLVMFQWTFYCVADNPQLSGVEAMKQSWALAKSNLAAAAIAVVVSVLLSAIGSMVAIGFVVTTPIAMTITAAIYESVRTRPLPA